MLLAYASRQGTLDTLWEEGAGVVTLTVSVRLCFGFVCVPSKGAFCRSALIYRFARGIVALAARECMFSCQQHCSRVARGLRGEPLPPEGHETGARVPFLEEERCELHTPRGGARHCVVPWTAGMLTWTRGWLPWTRGMLIRMHDRHAD